MQAQNDAMVEDAAIIRMTEWFSKFKSQMPGHGRDTRTAELIRRGVLRDERDARFHGFDLSPWQRERSLDQEPCREEVRHNESVLSDLRATRERMEAHAAEFAAAKRNVKPSIY
jgi:hypothetical protein